MIPFLSERHETFRHQVRAALDEVISPHAAQWESQGHISRQSWRDLGARGLLGLPHYGNGFLDSAVFLEELGATGFAGVRAAVAVHAYMALCYLERFGSAAQRRRYVDAARRGERIVALAITEQTSGSDLRQLATRMEPHGEGGYRLHGHKHYVTNGSQADVFVVLAATGAPGGQRSALAGASLLVVDADLPGVSRFPQRMLGWYSADVCGVEFADVVVPADRVLGRPGKALLQLVPALDFERLVAGLVAVGGVRHCLDLLSQFTRSHRVKDAPLSANQAIRHQLAELRADFELVRCYAYRTAMLQATGRLDTGPASILKLKATELAVTAAQVCVQYHGARGYLDDSTAARLYRDAMAGTIAAGASELMREVIFEAS